MILKIHKKLTTVSTKCGRILFATFNGFKMSEKWEDVTCKQCLAKRK